MDIASYHNHTKWSDGASTAREMCREAEHLGLPEVGLSDHYVLTPSSQPVEWTMPVEKLSDYVAELSEVAAEQRATPLRLGIEADFFPETVDAVNRALREQPLDFVVGSVHFVGGFAIDSRREEWERLTEDEREQVWVEYWDLIRRMAQSGAYDLAAHLDLPKKFGHRPRQDLEQKELAALDAIAAAGMAIEINTAGWYLPAAEAYPSPRLLRAARERDIELAINADAHQPELLTRGFDRAISFARSVGYERLVRFQQRERYTVPLPASL